MGFILAVIDYVRKIVVAKRKLASGVIKAINYKKIISAVLAKYVAYLLAIVIFFGSIVYSITYAVKDGWDYLTTHFNTTDIDVLYEQISNMTDEEIEEFMKSVAALHPKKILQYIDKQRESTPSEIFGTKTIDNDGSISTESVALNVQKLVADYILPWQLVGAMDVITFRGLDLEDETVINSASLAQSEFFWVTDATSDETKYWKDWEVKTKVDSKEGTTVLSDGENSAKEHHYTVKTPLALLEKVNSCFGVYTYNIKKDVTVVDEAYSSRQLVSKTCTKSERVVYKTETKTNEDGSKSTKKYYKTVKYYTYKYTKTRNTLIEDQMTGPSFTFEPSKFIRFLNSSGYSIKDLNLLKMTLESLPNTSNYLDMIDRIVEGNYGDLEEIGDLGTGTIDGLTGSGSSNIPLFHQWDSRWGNIAYGSSGTICSSGCGPTSMAMILTGLQGNLKGIDKNNDGIADPAEAAAYSVAHGYRVEGQGTSWGYFQDISKQAGLNCKQYSISQYQQVYEELKKGKPVIASMGPGHFTKSGHFIVLASVLEDGKIKVNDPNREECSKTPWDFKSIIVPEALQFWVFDNPNRKSADFVATGYTAAADECAGGTGITANGTQIMNKTLRDKYIAVDTKVIPLNSKVYIEVSANIRWQTLPDGSKVDMNGYYTAVDTGSAIKGNIVDIYFGTGNGYKELCYKFGRQNISLYK
jgi:3D (Asp-Asp-Asp) domain-containing protein